MKKYEIQTLVAATQTWENVCVVVGEDGKPQPMQFETIGDAEAELSIHLKDLKAAFKDGLIEEYRPEFHKVAYVLSVPMYEIGHRMKWREECPSRKIDVMITYRYHNGETWKYHVGLIVGREPHPVPPMYVRCSSLKSLDGYMVVDYMTAAEHEVEVHMEFFQ